MRRSPLLLLLGVLACSHESKVSSNTPGEDTAAPADTNDSQIEQDSADSADSAADTAADSGVPVDTADSAETETAAETAAETATDSAGDTAIDTTPPTAAECFADIWGDGSAPVPDYDAYGPILGSHCEGTNHQDITGIERVVFIGDSITVGSPPTDPSDFYRVQLADWLVSTYGLDAPTWDWEWYDAINGTTITQESGSFASCAKWGARTDDLIKDHDQVVDCLPEEDRDLTTLVVITMGGNDLFSLVEDYYAGVPVADLWVTVEDYMNLMREAVEWMTSDPTRFPGGIYVVFANLYEFTDSLGNVDACPGADTLGYTYDLSAPDLVDMFNWSQEEYMHISVDTGTDMVFLGEGFCGHGYNRDETTGRCYRGPDAELWFDLTCFHPNNVGHPALAQMFEDVIAE